MKISKLAKTISSVTLLFAGVAASPGECPPPLPYPSHLETCGCRGDLASARTSNGYQVTQTLQCANAKSNWVDVYRHTYGGSNIHVAYCTMDTPGLQIPAQPCSFEDWGAVGSADYYTATVGISYDGNDCGGLYNDAIDAP